MPIKRSNQKAFSLLELIMVLLIIVVLMQIAVPYISISKMTSNEAVIEKVLSNMSTASEQFSAENGLYPVSSTELAMYMEGQDYCLQQVSGYDVGCLFTTGTGYTYTATPSAPGQTGSITFTISTGGAWATNP